MSHRTPTKNKTAKVSGITGINFDDMTLIIKPDFGCGKKAKFKLDIPALITLQEKSTNALKNELYKAQAEARAAEAAKGKAEKAKAIAEAAVAAATIFSDEDNSSSSDEEDGGASLLDPLPSAFKGLEISNDEEIVETQQLF